MELKTDDAWSLTLEDGEYLVSLFVISGDATDSGTVSIEGAVPEEAATFQSQIIDGGGSWTELGPFPTSVLDGRLDIVIANGTLRLAGVELRRPGLVQ